MKEKKQVVNSILIIQLGDIGDVVLTAPTFRAVKENYPNCRLVACVREKARELVEDLPWVDEALSVKKNARTLKEAMAFQVNFFRAIRRGKFDVAVDLRTGTRGAIINFISLAGIRIGRFAQDGTLWRNRLFTTLVAPSNELNQHSVDHNLNILAPLNLMVTDKTPELTVTKEREKDAREIFLRNGVPVSKPIVIMHPFSLWRYKEWRMEAWARLADHVIKEYQYTVIITGSPDERPRAEKMVDRCKGMPFNLAGKTSIGELPAIIKGSRFFVGVDTAALHIASAVNVPTIGIFGPSSQINWAPRGPMHSVACKNIDCLPCRDKGCQNSEKSRCLDELSYTHVRNMLDERLGR